MTALRVGSVPYLVGRPLDTGLEHEPGMRFETDVPARLVERLRAGDLDVALMSSIELFRRPGYRYLDGPAVVGRGFVASVQLFHDRPLETVEEIALDPSSRSSATLLRILLERGGDPNSGPRFVEVERGVDPAAAGTGAWLRIGDAALREFLGPQRPEVFNPSQQWVERTGLPFVFAAWIVAPSVDLEPCIDAFWAARERGLRSVDGLARRAAREWSLPFEDCRHYLAEECSYDAGDELGASLFAFRDAAGRLGLCDPAAAPQPLGLPAQPHA